MHIINTNLSYIREAMNVHSSNYREQGQSADKMHSF